MMKFPKKAKFILYTTLCSSGINMKISNHSAVPVYTISGSSTARPLPEWLARKRKRSLKNDPEYANRIELLQDFEFDESSQCVRASDDGQWVMSTGMYHSIYRVTLLVFFAALAKSIQAYLGFRNIQTSNTYALSPPFIAFIRSTYGFVEYYFSSALIRLYQIAALTIGSFARIPYPTRLSLYYQIAKIWKGSKV